MYTLNHLSEGQRTFLCMCLTLLLCIMANVLIMN